MNAIIPTNDACFALNGVAGPRGGKDVIHLSPAYDAGSERNDEPCASIPGPDFAECRGPGGGGQPAGGVEVLVPSTRPGTKSLHPRHILLTHAFRARGTHVSELITWAIQKEAGMKRMRILLIAAMVLTGLLTSSPVRADEESVRFEVPVTNLTRGQTFTPVLVASHREGVTLFTLGAPASSELATLAEEGATAPLAPLLLATPGGRDVADSGAPPAGVVLRGPSKPIVVRGGETCERP